MRRLLADELYKHMKRDKRIYLIVGDLGYKVWDQHFKDFPDRCINVGAAEQTMMDIAVGLAYEGKIVFTYTITPFYLRAFETIRTYVDHENLPIIMLGSGRDKDYADDGISHDATDIDSFLKPLKNIERYYPEKINITYLLKTSVENPAPIFISLKR